MIHPANADDLLVVPLLHVPEVDFPLVRRLQSWQFAVLLHSFTALWCIWKDEHTTGARYVGPVILLVSSIIQLGLLLWHYPITEDVFATGLTICLGCWFYLLLVFTDMVCFKNTNISITLEIVLISFTVCMHALRFVAQDLFEFNPVRLSVAAVGCIPGAITLFRLYSLFSDPDAVLIDLIIHDHILFKISTVINSLFRLLDVIFIRFAATREIANYLQGKLKECFK